jgi:hypothetical protein
MSHKFVLQKIISQHWHLLIILCCRLVYQPPANITFSLKTNQAAVFFSPNKSTLATKTTSQTSMSFVVTSIRVKDQKDVPEFRPRMTITLGPLCSIVPSES